MMRTMAKAGLALATVLLVTTSWAWDPDDDKKQDSKAQEAVAAAEEAIALFKEKDPSIQRFFDHAAGYVVIPTVGKGGLGIGGARGTGLLYENGEPTGKVTLTQLTIGFQAGGQAYSEFIFFEDDVALASFKRGNYELGAQASAVAITAGASADANYNSGVAIFTQAKGGLMYEASVGGQKFKVELND
mgnify:FL=1